MAIPIIDFACLVKGEQAEVSRHIGSACHEWGIFYVKNHGVQVEDLMFESRNFFNVAVEHKQKAVPKSGYFGYFHKGGETTLGKKDCKEGLYLRVEYPNEKISEKDRGVMRCPNHWPESKKFSNYKNVVSEYLQATRQVAFKLAECMAICLGLEKSHFNERLTERPFQRIGMFHYPLSDDELYPWGVGPHCDIGFLTVLLQDNIGGLQVKAKDGSWVDVPPIDGTLIVNVGDVAEIWTNGFYHSVMHRVAKPTTRDRYSVATFVDPGLECIIVPGDTKGNSNCEIDERLKSLSSAPYKFEDFLSEYYARFLTT